jgi:cation diffusion facilitator family transporter
MTRTMKAAWGGLGVSVIALGLKLAAYWVTGSVALYSDALETTINVVGALTALIALWFSEQPADANHPYGHRKAEYISAAVEAFMVVATAFAIGREAYFGWQNPRAPETPFVGIAFNAASGIVNLLWALFLIRVGRRWRSPALAASGKHIMTDVWTSGGILVGFALIPLTGWLRLDPALAADKCYASPCAGSWTRRPIQRRWPTSSALSRGTGAELSKRMMSERESPGTSLSWSSIWSCQAT